MTDRKREADRVPLPGEVRGEVTVYQPMTVIDMSERGAQIETSVAFHVDSLHEFRLTLGDLSVVVKGRIAHCQIVDVGGDGVRYRSGVEFIEPAEHAIAAIRAFVAARRFAQLVTPAVIDAEIADDGL